MAVTTMLLIPWCACVPVVAIDQGTEPTRLVFAPSPVVDTFGADPLQHRALAPFVLVCVPILLLFDDNQIAVVGRNIHVFVVVQPPYAVPCLFEPLLDDAFAARPVFSDEKFDTVWVVVLDRKTRRTVQAVVSTNAASAGCTLAHGVTSTDPSTRVAVVPGFCTARHARVLFADLARCLPALLFGAQQPLTHGAPLDAVCTQDRVAVLAVDGVKGDFSALGAFSPAFLANEDVFILVQQGAVFAKRASARHTNLGFHAFGAKTCDTSGAIVFFGATFA